MPLLLDHEFILCHHRLKHLCRFWFFRTSSPWTISTPRLLHCHCIRYLIYHLILAFLYNRRRLHRRCCSHFRLVFTAVNASTVFNTIVDVFSVGIVYTSVDVTFKNRLQHRCCIHQLMYYFAKYYFLIIKDLTTVVFVIQPYPSYPFTMSSLSFLPPSSPLMSFSLLHRCLYFLSHHLTIPQPTHLIMFAYIFKDH